MTLLARHLLPISLGHQQIAFCLGINTARIVTSGGLHEAAKIFLLASGITKRYFGSTSSYAYKIVETVLGGIAIATAGEIL